MPDQTLTAKHPFGDYDRPFGDTRLRAVTDLALVSAAMPLGSAVPDTVPDFGTSREDDGVRVIRMAPDQVMLVISGHGAPDMTTALGHIGGEGQYYATDQSDAWVALDLDGPLAGAALERLSPVDLSAHAFPVDAAARTVMEHLGVIVVRTGPARFLLLSARSSARSFLHAVEQSLKNVS